MRICPTARGAWFGYSPRCSSTRVRSCCWNTPRTASTPNQVILSTHSATVVNALRPEEVRLVTMENGETKARALNQRELGAATKYVAAEGGALADFLEPLEG
jgi:hypothetical protein